MSLAFWAYSCVAACIAAEFWRMTSATCFHCVSWSGVIFSCLWRLVMYVSMSNVRARRLCRVFVAGAGAEAPLLLADGVTVLCGLCAPAGAANPSVSIVSTAGTARARVAEANVGMGDPLLY